MMMQGMGRKRGIFGMMEPEGYSMPQDQTMRDGASLALQPQAQQRPGIGTRLFGEGWEGKAAALGAMLAGNPNAIQQYQGQQQALQLRSTEQAAELAAEQRRRAEGLADYGAKKEIDQRYATPEKDAFDRSLVNAGIDPKSPQGIELYRQRAMTMAQGQPQEPRMVSLPDGRAIFGTMDEIQRILGSGQSAPNAPRRPVGGLTPIGGGGVSNGTGSF